MKDSGSLYQTAQSTIDNAFPDCKEFAI